MKSFQLCIDTHCNELHSQYMWPSSIEWIIISIYWLPLNKIAAQYFGKAECGHPHAWVAFLLPTMRYLATGFSSSAILLFMNEYLHVTVQSSPIVFLQAQFLVKHQIEPGRNILTDFVISFLLCYRPPSFNWTDHHEYWVILLHWPLSSPNESGNVLCRSHIQVVWGVQNLNFCNMLDK